MVKADYIFKKSQDLDRDRFASLLLAAKGGRTLKDFAELCEVNPSTLTRIVQKVNKGASSAELLQAIAANAAKGSGVTLQALADANGYTLESDNGIQALRLTGRGSYTEVLLRDILIQELLDRNAGVRLGNIRYEVSKTLSLRPDALIMTDAFGEKDEVWFVELMSMPNNREMRLLRSQTKQKAFQLFSRFSFISMKQNMVLLPKHFSIVVDSQEMFDVIKEEFGEMEVPTNISVILIDFLNGGIVDEFVLPRSGGNTAPSYFMTVEKAIRDENQYIGSDDFDNPV